MANNPINDLLLAKEVLIGGINNIEKIKKKGTVRMKPWKRRGIKTNYSYESDRLRYRRPILLLLNPFSSFPMPP